MNRILWASGVAILVAGCASPAADLPPQPSLVLGQAPSLLNGPRWSPDGSRIAYAKSLEGKSAIFVANADGSNEVRLTFGVWDTDPEWSPDGRWIGYYSDEGFDIYVVPSTGGERHQITSGPEQDGLVQWLPDGSGLVFERIGAGNVRTFVAPLDGGPTRPLGEIPGVGINASVSPDGSRFLMEVERDGQNTIWVQSMTGGEPRQLTTEGFEDPYTAWAWSPDSRSILYESGRTGTLDLWVLDAETGAQRQLTNDIRDDFAGRWSPDGTQIVFTSNRGGTEDLWIVPAVGGEARRLTDWSPADERDPAWSPDGSTISFLSDRDAAVPDIWTVPSAGGTPTRLTTGADVGTMAWSIDGKEIFYSANGAGDAKGLFAVASGGGVPRRLVAGEVGMVRPSPDGTRLAHIRFGDGWAFRETVPAVGGTPRRLTTATENVYQTGPQWSPDGSMIVVDEADFVTNGQGLSVVTVSDGVWRRLPQTAGAFYMAQPRWIPGRGDLLHFEGEFTQRIVSLPMTSVLAPKE